jgi:hypothetical protein
MFCDTGLKAGVNEIGRETPVVNEIDPVHIAGSERRDLHAD